MQNHQGGLKSTPLQFFARQFFLGADPISGRKFFNYFIKIFLYIQGLKTVFVKNLLHDFSVTEIILFRTLMVQEISVPIVH